MSKAGCHRISLSLEKLIGVKQLHRDYPVRMILSELRRNHLLPTILFRSSRAQCNEDVVRISKQPRSILRAPEKENIRESIDHIVARYSMSHEVIYGHEHFEALVEHGVGAHHAGQLLVWRLLLEELMAKGALKMMMATGTVAAGVDFPARSVIITAHSKRGSTGFRFLTSSEFQQMSGRAGRRGKDSVGFCLVAPSIYSDARVIDKLVDKPPEALTSSYFASPSTVLNLLKYRNVDDLRYTVDRSLAAFQDKRESDKLVKEAKGLSEQLESLQEGEEVVSQSQKKLRKRIRRLEREADQVASQQSVLLEFSLTGLERLGYLSNGCLTPKGEWAAALCTNLILEIGEAIESGVFDELDYRFLAALVGCISGDAHRLYFQIRDNPVPKEYFEQMEEVVSRVADNYQSPLKQETKVVPSAALTVLSWLESKSWSDFSGLLRLAGVAQGDVSRLVTQTAENLNQISHLTVSHPLLATAAAEARMKLLRPPLSDTLVVKS